MHSSPLGKINASTSDAMESADPKLDRPAPPAPVASPLNLFLILMVVCGVLSFLLWLAVVRPARLYCRTEI